MFIRNLPREIILNGEFRTFMHFPYTYVYSHALSRPFGSRTRAFPEHPYGQTPCLFLSGMGDVGTLFYSRRMLGR